MRKLLAVSTALLLNIALAAPVEELVPSLPDMGSFKFKLYSGYLDIAGTSKTLHYVFSESKSNPMKDPLIFWFNGGPGCSSMLGFLKENGPWVMDDETSFFFENPWSWNN